MSPAELESGLLEIRIRRCWIQNFGLIHDIAIVPEKSRRRGEEGVKEQRVLDHGVHNEETAK